MFALWLVISVGLAIAVHSYGYQDRAQSVDSADTIIILGAGVTRNNNPTAAQRRRVERGAELWAQGLAPTVICTGGMPGYATISEASTCRELLLARGVPASAIIMEERSRSTEENALYSREIMAANGWQTAIVVSDRYHLFRAEWLFNTVGITPYTSPVSVSYMTPFRYAWQVAREVAALEWQVVKIVFNLPFTYVPLL